MVVRTYFDKNNTIIFNSEINTGKNPVTELYYGGDSYSRFIFHFDCDRLINLYSGGTFPNLSQLKHTLRMTNTGAFDTQLLGKYTCSGKCRSTSFDLNLFKVNQDWDEGVGYDYTFCNIDASDNSIVTSTHASNWFNASGYTNWVDGNGTYSGSPNNILITQHFEDGNECLEMDITDIVNSYITGETNYGLGLAYPRFCEEMDTQHYEYTGFFTRHTQTFYEPYIETIYNCNIKDDRYEFFTQKDNKLYLYVNTNGKPTNLDVIPTVTIYDNCDNVVEVIDQSGVTHCTKGVYFINLTINSGSTGTLMYDKWSNIFINGKQRPDIELSFELKDDNQYYNIGDADYLPQKVGFTISGIHHDERIKRGDIRKVLVQTRIPYTVNQTIRVDELKYRLYVKEGKNEYTVIDYQDVEITPNTNYFLIDTESLLPTIYYLDVKYSSNLEVTTQKEVLKFEIVSQSELRNSQ